VNISCLEIKKQNMYNMKTGKSIINRSASGLALFVLLTVFASCDGLGDGREDRQKAEVQFSLGSVEGWGESTVLRGASPMPRLVETVSVPLENNWILEASLTEEAAAPTRATENLQSGSIVRIIALSSTSPYDVVAKSDYVCQWEDNLSPVNDPMKLEDGNYYFIAYSYNSATAASLPPTIATLTTTEVTLSPYNNGDDETNDLILSMNTSVTPVSSSGGITLSTLEHQFSQVKYALSVEGGATPTDFEVLLSNNYAATLTKTAGLPQVALTKGALLSTPQHINTVPCIVNTGEETPVLNISGAFGSQSFTDVPIVYTKSFEPGKSYTLQIKIRRGLQWAGSNVYWVEEDDPMTSDIEGYLTFAEPPGTTDEWFYQGLFFRWGSLVGVSPTRTTTNTTTGDNFSISATYIYVPVHNNDKNLITWKRMTVAAARAAYSWEKQFVQYSPSYGDFDYIPAVNTPASGTRIGSNNYLTRDYDDANPGGHNPAAYKGDICKYLTGQPHIPIGNWEMPTAADFNSASASWGNFSNYYTSWVKYDPNNQFPESVTGDNSLTFGHPGGDYKSWSWGASYCARSSGVATTVLPASGYRYPYTGALMRTGGSGFYWSSSVINNLSSAYMQFVAFACYGAISDSNRGSGMPVRCVMKHEALPD
jgi:hypothetical protein